MRVSELKNAQLDYWVARALWPEENIENIRLNTVRLRAFAPTENWLHGGPILQLNGMGVGPYIDHPGKWTARFYQPFSVLTFSGSSPLEAIMRCFVAAKFGDEVEDIA